MSGWSADNPEHPPPAGATGWTDAPPPEPPAWAAPEAATSDHAWALPEVGHAEPTAALAPGASQGGDGGSAPGTAAAGAGWDASPEAVAPPVLPVALKAMTFTDIVDGAWGIIKARPRTVFAITAMILLPTEILAAFLAQGGSSLIDLWLNVVDQPQTAYGPLALGVGGIYLAALIQNLSLFFLGGAIARLVSSWYAGGDMTAREAVVASLRKAPALLGAFAVLVPVKVLGWAVTCGLGLPFLIPLFMITAPAIVIEDLGPIAGIKRSVSLVRRRYWPCIGVWALALVVELTVNVALSVVPSLVGSVTPGAIAPIVESAGTVFAAFITAPFVVGVAVLLYLDLRVRTEGLDLELDATAAFARAA